MFQGSRSTWRWNDGTWSTRLCPAYEGSSANGSGTGILRHAIMHSVEIKCFVVKMNWIGKTRICMLIFKLLLQIIVTRCDGRPEHQLQGQPDSPGGDLQTLPREAGPGGHQGGHAEGGPGQGQPSRPVFCQGSGPCEDTRGPRWLEQPRLWPQENCVGVQEDNWHLKPTNTK